MAATVKCYGKACVHLPAGDIDWASDTIKLALCTSAYTPNQGTDEFFSDVTDEIAAGGGYTAGGLAVTSEALAYDATTRENRFEGANVSVAALTPASPFRYGIIYKDTGTAGTSPLLAYINFGADQDPGGLPFALQWATTGLFYIQAA